jgi:hypothetical protein
VFFVKLGYIGEISEGYGYDMINIGNPKVKKKLFAKWQRYRRDIK